MNFKRCDSNCKMFINKKFNMIRPNVEYCWFKMIKLFGLDQKSQIKTNNYWAGAR